MNLGNIWLMTINDFKIALYT